MVLQGITNRKKNQIYNTINSVLHIFITYSYILVNIFLLGTYYKTVNWARENLCMEVQITDYFDSSDRMLNGRS